MATQYGDTIVDTMGRTGTAKFDSETGQPLANPSLTQNPQINAETLVNPQTPLKINPRPSPTQAAGLNEYINTTMTTEQKGLEIAEANRVATEQALQGKTQSKNTFLDFITNRKGKTTLTDEQYSKDNGLGYSTDQAKNDLKEINNKILAVDNGYRKQIEAIRANTDGKFGGAVEQDVRTLERKAASEKADLYIEQLAKQGKYDSAKEISDRAVAMALEEDQIKFDAFKLDYEDNKEQYNKDEQRQYEFEINQYKEELDAKKAELKGAKDMALEAQKSGAPSSIVQAMLKATTMEEAASIGGEYVGKLDRELQRSQLYTQSLNQQKLLQELNPDDSSSNDDLSAYAAQYADTGKLPSPSELKLSGLNVGQVTAMAKQMPKPEGALVSNKTGTKSAALSSAQEDGVLALYDISKKTAELKALEEKRVKGLTSAAAGKLFGFNDQENYINLRTEIIDLLARARTGAALTTQEEAFYKSQLPGRIGQVGFGLFGANTQNKINNFEKKINGTLQTKLNGYDASIYGYSKVNVNGVKRTVGEVLDIGGQQYKVLPDGKLTDII